MNATPAPRLQLVDALRGFAVAQMIVYHFIYDLAYFGWIELVMTRDQPWTAWRTAIVTQFLLLVGVSLVLRTSFKPSAGDFWKRWAQIAAAALLVSVGSWLVFGQRFIYFGILHFVAAALLIARPLLILNAWNIALGAACVAIGLIYTNQFFDMPPATIVGFMTFKPRTEDYVPLFPWLGVVLIGAGLAALWRNTQWGVSNALLSLNERAPRWLLFLGTWALTVYLVHQPIMLGSMTLLRKLGV
ncbi:MAG TPA: heparan-alpha-glucosaminide N-acetyltransferase [Burkholderiaceae bacterium]|nr:heparan-alpha-glucosaminide N-acetyltransferase [Burkholderiaceae bacterium]